MFVTDPRASSNFDVRLQCVVTVARKRKSVHWEFSRMAKSIHQLMSVRDYATRSAPYIASEASVRYLMRLHGKRLQARGAVVRLGSRMWIDPEVMDEAVVALARESATPPADE